MEMHNTLEIANIQRIYWCLNGGADRNRTCDLLIANETLYQLSYDPIHQCSDTDSLRTSGPALQQRSRHKDRTVRILDLLQVLAEGEARAAGVVRGRV